MSFSTTGIKIKQKAVLTPDVGVNNPSLVDLNGNQLPNVLDSVTFDVSENETHKSSAKVTDHPVEQGANIADHIVIQPDTLDLVARVSNTPIETAGVLATLDPQRAEAAYQDLVKIKNAGTTCSILTTLRSYKNMVITALSATRNAANGDCLAVTLTLQEIRTATSETIEAPTPKVARGNVSLDMGKKATKEAEPEADESSKTILLKFAQKISDNVTKLSTP